MASKYPFPYSESETNVKFPDGGKKLGGWSVYAILKAGWYQLMNRKDRNAEIGEAMSLARKDPQFKALLEKARKQVKAG